jgi:hypothetical protein
MVIVQVVLVMMFPIGLQSSIIVVSQCIRSYSDSRVGIGTMRYILTESNNT